MANYQLLDIPLKQSFANSGIKQRVPYQLPAADDDLNWLEGFTDAYQRPVIPDNLGEKSGRYVRMGQINQILENVSQAFLNVKQSLDNVSKTIDKSISVEIDKVVTNANNTLTNRKAVWLQTFGNQYCAGLKNFTSVNINNFKNSPQAVANLEWCNGAAIQTANYWCKRIESFTTFTITQKSGFLILTNNFCGTTGCINCAISIFLNNNAFQMGDSWFISPAIFSAFSVRNKDVVSYTNTNISGTPGCYDCPEYRRSTWQGN